MRPVYVVSDLHLEDQGLDRLFDDERHGVLLKALCERIARDGGELVLLGDSFDLTGMLPPARGLEHFFETMELRREPQRRRSLPELCAAAAGRNPVAVAALADLSRRAPVTLVPGNHDRFLGGPEAAAALATIGLQVRVANFWTRRVGDRQLVLLHGHEWDPSNARADGGGEVLTNVLHQAVFPFLQEHGARAQVQMDATRVVALRPEEAVVSVLQRWLDEKTFRKFFRAFLRLLAENRYLPRALSWATAMVSVDRVRARVERSDRLWEETARRAQDALRGDGALPWNAPRPDVLLVGHTHVLDWAAVERKNQPDGLYANLGTWTERCLDACSPPDVTLPVVRVADGEALALTLHDLESGRELQRFETARPALRSWFGESQPVQ